MFAGGSPKRLVRVLLVAMVAVLLLSALPFGSLYPKPAFADSVLFGDPVNSTTYEVFGPNATIMIWGDITWTATCGAGGLNDGMFAWANIYVVQDGQVSGSTRIRLTDVSGAPNTVVGGWGGLYLDEVLGYTKPAGSIGPGAYDVVIDNCQDGYFDPGQDYILGFGSQVAFRVNIPANVPVLPSASIVAAKNRAAQEYVNWERMHGGLWVLFQAHEVMEVVGAMMSPSEAVIWLTGQIVQQATGVDPKKVALINVLNQASHYRGLAADPPDPNFQVLPELAARNQATPKGFDPIEVAGVNLGNAADNEGVLVAALVKAIERYQGADAASDGEWALIHARRIKEYAQLIAIRKASTNGYLAALRAALQAYPADFDSVAAQIETFRARVVASGFNVDEVQEFRNRGYTQAQMDAIRADLASRSYAGFSEASLASQIDDLIAANQAAIGEYQTLAGDMDPIISQLQADPYTFATHPAARAGGPYSGNEGTPLGLSASGSTDPNGDAMMFTWDLDGDAQFDDAIGAAPSFAFAREMSGTIGVKATDATGRSDVSYAAIDVANVNSRPTVSSFVPADRDPVVRVGSSLNFRVFLLDPEGDLIDILFYIDGVSVGPGDAVPLSPSYTYSPSSGDIGVHILEAVATDRSGLGGSTYVWWVVSVLAADADGDGWAANVDCDDGNPNVNPGRSEVIGNGIDDDCNAATLDTGTPPTANFTNMPAVGVLGEPVQFTDTSTDLDSAIVSWSWELGDGTTSTVQNPSYAYASAGTYAVTLTVRDPQNNVGSVVKNVKVTLPPTAAFTYSPAQPRVGESVQFTDTSSDADGSIVGRSWQFGDGGSSTLQNPTHAYGSPGTFTAVLTVTDNDGAARSYSRSIGIGSPPAAFFNPQSGTRNVALSEAGATVVAYSSQVANHTAQGMLVYDSNHLPWATTSITNQWARILLVGGKTYLIDRIRVMPRADGWFDQRVKDFKIAVSTTTSDDSAFTTVFTGTAAYNGNLQEFVLSRPVFAKYVRYSPLSNYGNPTNISTTQLKVMTGQEGGQTVAFQDLSTDADGDITSYLWDFGDGATSTERNPVHTFPGPGTYTVSQTVFDSGGHSNTFTLTQRVLTVPTGSISYTPAMPNEGQSASFTLASSDPDGGAVIKRILDWGDGSAAVTNPSSPISHVFPDNKTYSVTLDLVDDQEQTGRITQTVNTANLPPTVNAGPDKTQEWGPFVRLGSSVGDPGAADVATLATRLEWGDGIVENLVGGQGYRDHTYMVPGVYSPTLTTTDKDGASASDQARVTINKRSTSLTYQGPAVLRVGEAITLKAKLNNLYGTMSGKTVLFTVGSQVFTTTTDSAGNVAVNNIFGAGVYPIALQFDGDTYYNASTGSGTITIYDDWTAPITSFSLAGSQLADGWFTTNVTVTLVVTDGPTGSGVQTTQYSLNGGINWTNYTGPFVMSTAGSNILWARSTDRAGNQEAYKETFVKIDKTPLIDRIPSGQGGLDWLTIGVHKWTTNNNCLGCHVQGVSLYGMGVSASTGYIVNQSTISGTEYLVDFIARSQGPSGSIGRYPNGSGSDSNINTLDAFVGMGLAAYDRFLSTARSQVLVKLANWVRGRQQSNGRWIIDHTEPPVDQGDTMVTGSFIQVLAQARQRVDLATAALYQAAIDKAVTWIRGQTPSTNQDKTYAIIGLKAAGLSNDDPKVASVRDDLFNSQIADASWRERSGLPAGSAFATGQALYALCQAGVTLEDPRVRAGINWLIHSQQSHNPDGLVNKYFENGPWIEGVRYVNTDAVRPSKFLATIWPVVALGCYGELGLQISADPTRQVIEASYPQSQTVTYTVTITNSGQVTDTYSLAVSGGMPGWTASLDKSSITLNAQQAGTATLTVVAPPNLPESLPVYFAVVATSQSAGNISALASVTTVTNPPPPTSGHATQTTLVAGNGVSAVVSDTIRLAARVTDTVSSVAVVGPGKGTVTFFVAGVAVGSDTDADGNGIFEINWRPSWQWNLLGTQDYRAIYFGVDLPNPAADLMSSFAAGSLTLSRPQNNPPVANAGGPYTTKVGLGVTLDGSASTDPDLPFGDTLSYSWDINNDGTYDLSGASTTLSWAQIQSFGLVYPANPQTGLPTNVIALRVSDFQGLSSVVNTTLTITQGNTAPSLDPIGPQIVNEETLLSFTARATDPDVPANRLTFSLDPGAPAGAAINPDTGVFNWTPTEVQGPGTYGATIRVSDDGTPSMFDARSFNITVNEVNRPPVLAPIPSLVVDEQTPLTFVATASDPDVPANRLTYSVEGGAPAGASIDASTGVFNWTPSTLQIGVHTVSVRVTDDGSPSLADVKAVSITVLDKTPPRTTAVPSPGPNANGWNNTDVALALSAVDNIPGSGVKEISYSLAGAQTGGGVVPGNSASVTLSAEGIITVTYFARDNAGNQEAAKTIVIRIDKTPPQIVSTRTPGANANGWNNTPVEVRFDASDNLSDVDRIPVEIVSLTLQGANQSATATFADLAGNTASATVANISIDWTPPSVESSRTPGPNAAGWNNSPVTVVFSGTDSLSGLDTVPVEIVSLSVEGANQSVSRTFRDKAGNSATGSISGINIDLTPPTIAFGAQTPAPNATGWNNTDVSIPYAASDNLSGVASTNPGTSPVVLTAEGASATASVVVSDRAGNSSTYVTPAARIDKTPPTIVGSRTPGPNSLGWNNTNVTVSFVVSDALSGIASSTPDTVVTAEGQNQSVTGTATDKAGNSATATVGGISIDKTNPEIVIASPTAGPYLTSDTITIVFAVSDLLSGLYTTAATLDGAPVSNGQVVPLAAMAGSHTLTVLARDRAGNELTRSVTFGVRIGSTVDCDPNTLNLGSRSDRNAVTCYVEFPNVYDVNLVNVSTVRLTVLGTAIPAQLAPTSVGDYDLDGIRDRMVKFDRQLVISALGTTTGNITFTVSGQLTDGRWFVGSDVTRVIAQGQAKP
ncbi:MAG: PKD domain-containing protein [Chloroflexi bacterium]|nr:PKD domain-containing protein [Chloroflexota bacterium]